MRRRQLLGLVLSPRGTAMETFTCAEFERYFVGARGACTPESYQRILAAGTASGTTTGTACRSDHGTPSRCHGAAHGAATLQITRTKHNSSGTCSVHRARARAGEALALLRMAEFDVDVHTWRQRHRVLKLEVQPARPTVRRGPWRRGPGRSGRSFRDGSCPILVPLQLVLGSAHVGREPLSVSHSHSGAPQGHGNHTLGQDVTDRMTRMPPHRAGIHVHVRHAVPPHDVTRCEGTVLEERRLLKHTRSMSRRGHSQRCAGRSVTRGGRAPEPWGS